MCRPSKNRLEDKANVGIIKFDLRVSKRDQKPKTTSIIRSREVAGKSVIDHTFAENSKPWWMLSDEEAMIGERLGS
jgi:hypothetical protein